MTQTIDTIETHTAGMPTRVVTSGPESLRLGRGSVAAKRDAFVADHDYLRRRLIMEPRGHDDMFGAVLVAPRASAADIGVFFMNAGGCEEDLCIHGLIGVVTALLETGRLTPAGTVRIETPAGIVTARPRIEDGRVTSVAIEGVPCFVRATGVPVPIDAHERPLTATLIDTGNVFALLDAGELGVDVSPETIPRLLEPAGEALSYFDAAPVRADERPGGVNAVVIYQDRPDGERTVVIAPHGHVDRSPSGTGTAARMTLRHHTGEQAIGDRFRAESVLGTAFTGRLLRETTRAGEPAVVPEIEGTAHITATQTFIHDPDDPLVGFAGLGSRDRAFELTTAETQESAGPD